jgi:hypothetical protein
MMSAPSSKIVIFTEAFGRGSGVTAKRGRWVFLAGYLR